MGLKKLINSFYFASEGIVYAINTQRNMKIHLSISLIVLLAGMYLHFNQFEVIIIFLCIASVIAAEIFNTAIERIVDMLTKEFNPSAKAAKDLAAGAVFLTVIIVIFIGIVLLFPYIQAIYSGGWVKEPIQPLAFFSLMGLFVLLITYALKACWYKDKSNNQPNALIGISFYLLSLLSIIFFEIIFFLGFILLFFIVFLLLKKVSWIVIIQNGIISIGGTYLLYWSFY